VTLFARVCLQVVFSASYMISTNRIEKKKKSNPIEGMLKPERHSDAVDMSLLSTN
jgi:hypothetical protein